MISDDQVQAALDYLRDSAPKAAVARSQAKTLDKFVGVEEARLKMLATQDGMSNAASQDYARSGETYKQALNAWQEAVRLDAEFTMLREAADARIRAWQTWEATNRAGRI